MRVMELCERSRMSKFSAPVKPRMDVILLWPSRRIRKLVIFSQSTNEMSFSCDQTNEDLRTQENLPALTVYYIVKFLKKKI